MKKDSSELILEWSEKIKDKSSAIRELLHGAQRKNISPNTFQYWKKRIKTAIPQQLAKKRFSRNTR